jgi:peptidoglycan hydrolase CwlO-like protein
MSEKWTDERIAAYKRYVENDKEVIENWRRTLKVCEGSVENAKSAIKSRQDSMEKTIKELNEQGIYI